MDRRRPAFSHVHTLNSVGRDPHNMDSRLLSLGNFNPICEVGQPLLGCSNSVRVQNGSAGMSLSAPHMPHVLWRIWLCWFMAAAAFPATGICLCLLLLISQEELVVLKNLVYSLYRKKLPTFSFFLNLFCCSKGWTHQLYVSFVYGLIQERWCSSMAY